MPKSFDDCVSGGGRVRRIVPKKGRYVNVCYDDSGSHSGYAHKTKSAGGDGPNPRRKRYGQKKPGKRQ